MGFRLFTFLIVFGASTLVSTEKFRYDGYHVISVNIENESHRELVEQLDGTLNDVQLLEMAIVNRKAVLVVGPNELFEVENMFLSGGLDYQVETNNLQK